MLVLFYGAATSADASISPKIVKHLHFLLRENDPKSAEAALDKHTPYFQKDVTPRQLERLERALLEASHRHIESHPKPDAQAAIQFVKRTYPGIHVVRMNDRTIGVIWETGAEDRFRELKTKIKKNFGVDAVITAIE